MSAKHTPAPWSFGYGVTTEYGEVFGVGVTTKPDWTVVCAVSRPGDVNAIDEANARLIAAAPDLLEALKAMVALDEEHHQRCQGDEDVCREVRQARYAIAKAIGDTK